MTSNFAPGRWIDPANPPRLAEGPGPRISLPVGRQILSYAKDHTLRTWDRATGKEVRRLALSANHCDIRWLAITPDGRRFLTNHQDLTIRLHDLASGREIHRFDLPPGAAPQGISISPDGRYAAGSFRGFVYLLRLAREAAIS